MFYYLLFIIFLVTDLLMIFYRGSCMYCHILGVLKRAGYKSKNPDWWNYEYEISSDLITNLDIEDFTREDAIAFITSKNRFLGNLISCHYCISWHFSFWVSAIVCIVFGLRNGFSIDCVQLFLFGLFTSPIISNLILKLL